jgi:hypothetical protein
MSENPSDGFISAPEDRKPLLRVKIRANKLLVVQRRRSGRLSGIDASVPPAVSRKRKLVDEEAKSSPAFLKKGL